MAEERNRLEFLERGLLDDMTKGTRQQAPGKRINNNNSARSAYPPGSASSVASHNLEFLSSEDILEQEFDLTFQDYESSEESDDSEDVGTGRTEEMFAIAEPVRTQRSEQLQHHENYEDDVCKQISLFDDEEVAVDSDEEASLIREIRAEITAQVRSEMQEELSVYQHARDKLKTPVHTSDDQDKDEMDPKLKEAIIKMKKLDRILSKKIKKEKEVKRERILLQKRLKEELENIKPQGREETKEVKSNTEKFMALALPPSHNAGVMVDEDADEDRDGVTPVFQTQVLEETLSKTSQKSTGSTKPVSHDRSGDPESLDSQSLNTDTFSSSTSKSGKKKRKKDFIQRNIQLSSDAANAIPMTDDEKKRIEDLLKDLDSIPDSIEESDSLQEHNPYQVAVHIGEGYLPTAEEMSRLEEIDGRLRMLLPPEDFESIASFTPRHTPFDNTDLFTRTGFLNTTINSTMTNSHAVNPREKALLQAKEQRDFQARLKEIEAELECLSSAVELEIESPSLSSSQLQELLDQCTRTMSRATFETDSLSRSTQRSEESSVGSSIPHLSRDVLDKLLADARQELSHGRRSSTPPRESTFITKDDVVLESITEDTLRELLRDGRTRSRADSREGSHPEYQDTQRHYESGYNDVCQSSGTQTRVNETVRRPFLPEIDPRGQLSTQKINGNVSRLHREDSWNKSISDISRHSPVVRRLSGEEEGGLDTPAVTPHPPSSGKQSNSGGRTRTMSPLVRN